MAKHWSWYQYDEPALDAINRHWGRYCTPPTLNELCAATACPTTSAMTGIVRRLAKQGHIEIRRGKPVPIWVIAALDKAWQSQVVETNTSPVMDAPEVEA